MHGRVPRRAVRVGADAHQLAESGCATTVVHDDAAEGRERAGPRERQEGVVGLAHPVHAGAVGDGIDGEAGAVERGVEKRRGEVALVLFCAVGDGEGDVEQCCSAEGDEVWSHCDHFTSGRVLDACLRG